MKRGMGKFGVVLSWCGVMSLAGLIGGVIVPPNRAAAETRLSLVEAQKLAADYAQRVKGAEARARAAALALKSSRAQRFPSLSVSSQAFYVNSLQSIDVFGGSREIGSKDNYQTDVRLTWPLFTGGRIAHDVRAKESDYAAAEVDVETQRLDIAYGCRRAYIELMIAESQMVSAQASLHRIEIIRDNVDNLFQGGVADSLDVLDAELSLRQARRIVEDRRTARSNANASLAALLGVDDGETIVIAEPVPEPQWDEGDTQRGEPAVRPELRAIERRIEAAKLRAGVMRATYFPTLSAFGGYSMGKPNRDFFGATWDDYFSAGVQLKWDVNLGGQTRADVARAVERVSELEASRRDVEDQLTLQVTVAVNNVGRSYRTYEVTREEYGIARRKFRLAEAKQAAGDLTVNRLLELEAELTSAEQDFKTARLLFHEAVTDYLYATGSDAIHGGLTQ